MNIEEYINDKFNNKEKLDVVEIEYLSNLIKKSDDKKIIDKFILLILLSKSNDEIYNKYIEYINRTSNDLSEEETLEFIKIYLDYLIDYVSLNQLKKIISRYLSFPSSREKLYELLKIYNKNLRFYKDLLLFIDNNPNDILFKMNLLLDRKEIDIKELEKMVTFFSSENPEDKYYVSNLNISVLKRVIKRFYELNDNLELKKLKYKFLQKVYTLLSKEQIELFIKKDIKDKKIVIDARNSSKHSNVTFDNVPFIESEHIISINNSLYSNIDVAFSISEMCGMYTLNIYISDVPSFLMKNETVLKNAYEKGSSMYLDIPGNNIYNIDIIPAFLSHKYLSLNAGFVKNVIRFNFLIGEDGEVYSTNVTRNKIIVDSTLSLDEVQNIINSDVEMGMDGISLSHLQELVNIAKKSVLVLQGIDVNNAVQLLSIIDLIINYYIGSAGKYVIYREHEIYTKDKISGYTHSSAPLNKFVSNINLALFMQQKGLVMYPTKKIAYIEENIDEIINHLNKRDMISDFVNHNGIFVKKYLIK